MAGAAAWAIIPAPAARDDSDQNESEQVGGPQGQSIDSRLAYLPIEVTDSLVRSLALTTVLSSRERAVIEGKRPGFDKHTTASMAKADGQRWNVLSALPLQEWSYRLTGEAKLALDENVPVLRQQATIFWRLKGSKARPAAATVQLAFQYKDGRWLLASESPIGGRTPMWESAGSAKAATSPSATVITLGGRGPGARAAADPALWLADVEAAAKQLRPELSGAAGDAGPVVAVVPADTNGLAANLGRERSTLDGLGAVSMDESAGYWTLTTSGGSLEPDARPAAQFIWINRDPWLGLNVQGRRIISRHEAFHILANAPSTGEVPLWFEEAVAEWIGYDGSGVPRQAILKDLTAAAANGKVPTSFPADSEFAGSTLETAYQGAWLAADLIADRIGREGLLKVYAGTAEGKQADPEANLDAALRKELGLDLAEFRRLWQDSIR